MKKFVSMLLGAGLVINLSGCATKTVTETTTAATAAVQTVALDYFATFPDELKRGVAQCSRQICSQ